MCCILKGGNLCVHHALPITHLSSLRDYMFLPERLWAGTCEDICRCLFGINSSSESVRVGAPGTRVQQLQAV